MTPEFHRNFLFVCCGLLLFSACNRKVVRSEDETIPSEEKVQITEEVEAGDDTMAESAKTEAMQPADVQPPSTAAAESELPTISDTEMPGETPVDAPIEDSMVMSDEEMLNVAPAERVDAMSPPPSATTAAAPSSSTPLPASSSDVDYSEYEEWFSSHGLDLNREGMLDEDPDGDGYTNRDEFLANTDPNDAMSHSGFHPVMRLKQTNIVEAPVMLEAVDGAGATVRNVQTGESARVSTGDAIPGTSLKVARVQRRVQTDKFGKEDDVSQLTVVNQSTGEEMTLVRKLPARTGSTTAVLVSQSDPSQTITVRQGQEFEFPGEPGKKYTVIDLRETQIVVREVGTGETWTIPKR